MASNLTRGRGNEYRIKEQQAKEKFESLNLDNVVREIYFTSIKKASEDYIVEIVNNRRNFLKTSYTQEQAQDRFNDYTEGIRIQNEEDDCLYRYYKNNFITENPEAPIEDLQEFIINAFCVYLKFEELRFTNKLNYLEELPQQIYESNKIQRQFMFFKTFAENHMNKDDSNKLKRKLKKEKYYLQSLIKENNHYSQVIELLNREGIIRKLGESTFDWMGKAEETSLKSLKLLATLGYVLKIRNYFQSNLTKKEIAEALTNTFPNFTLSNVYYGRVESELSSGYSGSKEEDYISVFHFINSL